MQNSQPEQPTPNSSARAAQCTNRIGNCDTQPEGFTYVPDLLDTAEREQVTAQVVNLAYEHDKFRGVVLNRSYAQFGHAYVSNGRKLMPAAAFPEFLRQLLAKASLYVGEQCFDQCIITQYPAGAGIGWHTDAARFDDVILGVSLGNSARLQFRRNGGTKAEHELLVSPGSLYVMQGIARSESQHRIVPVKSLRYSITFRHVRR